MNEDRYKDFITDDFVLDNDFISWILSPGKESDSFWSYFIRKYPEKRKYIEDASFIIRSFQPVEDGIPAGRLGIIFNRIKPEPKRRSTFTIRSLLKIAAVFALLTGIGFFLYHLDQSGQNRFHMVTIDPVSAGQGQVILSDGTVYEFETKETTIRQTISGQLLINRDTIAKTSKISGNEAPAMNHVVIPYGKRSELTLSDGTHIWLNSGSQISYPDEFNGKTREVYISGEAFFDVATDSEKPFFVITRDVRIRVLGTRFNVTAYKDDRTIQAALMSGKVTFGRNALFARTVELEPGEKVVFDREAGVMSKATADLQFINSWVHGYLILRNEPTTGIFKRLERYYNLPVVTEGKFDEITFSGKLDLKDDLKDVLENIAFASSLKVIHENNYYLVKQNAYEDN
jgi:transmembrane sensor